MSFLKNLSGFGNPISGVRRAIGCCVVIIGIGFLIPGFLAASWSSSIYSQSLVDQDSDSSFGTSVGNTTTTDTFSLTAGNYYDIRISYSAVGPNTDAQTGNIRVTYSLVNIDNADSGNTGWKFVDGYLGSTSFNGTRSGSNTEETDTLAQNAEFQIAFEITQSTDISGLTVTVQIYENPNRFWHNFLNNVAVIFFIIGGVICACGLCIAPPKKNQ